MQPILDLSRIKGVALGGDAPPTRKKSPLTVEQVKLLEHIAVNCHGQEAIFAGYVCFIIHCRLRWSDGQHCECEPHLDVTGDRGYIEASLYHPEEEDHDQSLAPSSWSCSGAFGRPAPLWGWLVQLAIVVDGGERLVA